MATLRSGIGDRLPQVVLILAAGIMITGVAIGFLAPSLRDAPPFVTDDVQKAAEAIAGNPTAWVWANGLILAAAILTTLGLVGLSAQFHGRSRTWAWTGLVAYAFAAMFMAVDRLITMQVTTWAAPRYPDSTVFTVWEAFDRFGGAPGGCVPHPRVHRSRSLRSRYDSDREIKRARMGFYHCRHPWSSPRTGWRSNPGDGLPRDRRTRSGNVATRRPGGTGTPHMISEVREPALRRVAA